MTARTSRRVPGRLLTSIDAARSAELGTKPGLLPRERINDLRHRRAIQGIREIEDSQLQPASLDLRLGAKGYRVRASFLPGKDKTVAALLDELKYDEISLERGALFERGCVYVVELLEILDLPEVVSGLANPKSSTGRLDIFTRLICDRGEIFDTVPEGYDGPLYLEVSPRSFSIKVRTGTRLNQLRFRQRHPTQSTYKDFRLSDRELSERHEQVRLTDGDPLIRNGLVLRVGLTPEPPGTPIGYKAQRHTDVIDVDRVDAYAATDYWDPIYARGDGRLILDPHEFYILASRERLYIPPDLAAEMIPIDPSMGEFRVHYAGFFDPGFGSSEDGHPGSKAVLEVRSHEVPFVLQDGQIIGRLAYERLAEAPAILYGQGSSSNYQGQGLKLSKHFRVG